MILPVILSGGSGSRLWPLSRKHHPKQFLSLINDNTMLQDTLLRLKGLECLAPYVVCNEGHRFTVAEQLAEIDQLGGEILLEPKGRNTAPAVALAALQATKNGEDPYLLILAADHVITDIEQFQHAVRLAKKIAEQEKLVTFGIVPDKAETGYGYIKGAKLNNNSGYLSVEQFVEKPDLTTAQQYLQSGEYYWNSGMFLFKASVYLQELREFKPEVYQFCQQAIEKSKHDSDFLRVEHDAFLNCPDDSIDYAIMEKTSRAAMIPLDAGWSDVGSWSSIWEVKEKDQHNNVLRGDVLSLDITESIIDARDKLVAVIGLDNVAVIETSDAVLVADKSRVQDIKHIVDNLNQSKRKEALEHQRIYRPWGHIDLLQKGHRYESKQVMIKPHARLSLQKHYHRAEHWIVVSGTARVRCDDNESLITENQSTYIPIGAVHAIENPGSIPLVMIEVQTGSYIGRDDIVRLEDIYGFEKDKF
ncbi:mannose-1-phosphate guanylyltransferase/mannose-6-phosphate isomerase [Photobacterium leiognathi]|uniref:mannose-1-phosphate guanylyltransferase/mannose-6-phosphate isomerase n=1 Tax=Photobacterium leiognathi TaxID=553611 RepID=UPI00298208FA|nr:mannose-1-phosphate guanylyltransferase/mannose-6-phosphate isomerase [Photobacterium leiognathi]